MRDDSISIAKATAILLMVLAHTCFSTYANHWINMFHMPLFFFFAGYCFKDKYLDMPKVFLKKRILGLYKPFVKWSIIFLLLHNVFFYLNIYNSEYGFRGSVSYLYAWKDFIIGIIHIITRMTDNEQLLGGYWFLKSLLVGSLIGYVFIKYFKKRLFGGGILLSMTIGLAFFHKNIPYFCIGAREFFSALFFFAGYCYKSSRINIHERFVVVPVSIFFVTFGVHFYQATLLSFQGWQVIPYGVTAIIAILAVFYLSKRLAQKDNLVKRSFVFIGNNTLTILTWHMLSFKLVSLIIIFVYGLRVEMWAEFPVIEIYSERGWFILYFLIGVTLPLLLTKCKYLK